MAGFGGGSGAAKNLNAVPLSADTSQQQLLTTPQHAWGGARRRGRPTARHGPFRCTAEFRCGLWPLWVIHDRCGRSHASMYVRCCPKADK